MRGRRGTGFALAVRGHVGDQIFQLEVDHETARSCARIPLEDRLIEEAKSLMRRAEKGEFPWKEHRFRVNEHGTWEKMLSGAELDRLMSD